MVGAAEGYPYLGVMTILITLPCYVLMISLYASKLKVFVFLLLSCVAGFVVDSLLVSFKAIDLNEQGLFAKVTAPFMWVLWPNFAILFDGALSWLKGRYLMGAFLGSLGGLFAYLLGEKIGALTVISVYGKSLIFLSWMFVVPFFLWANAFLERRFA